MKTFKRITALLIAMLAISLSAALFTACGGSHTCEYETAWTFDDENHWHKCKDADCTETSGKAAHTWDDGVETTAATVFAKGVKTYTCKECGKTKTEDVSVTENAAYFDALKASALKMQQSGSMYMIGVATNNSTSGISTGTSYLTWDSNGKGVEKQVYQSTSSEGTTTSTSYKLAHAVGDKNYLTRIESQKDGTFAINNKEYVSNDYWTKENSNDLDELMEQMTLSESDLKTMLIDSIKSMADSLDLIDSTTKKPIDMKDVAEENTAYACTVSLENGVAKIEATISFKTEWLSGVSAGEGVSVKNFDMKMIYAFTADKITKAENQYGFTMVMAGKEMANSMYTAYEFDTNFNQTLFDEAVAVEGACDEYKGTVKAHSARIKIYVNGEEYGDTSASYDDKAEAKTNIDFYIKHNVKYNLQEDYDETKDTVYVKAYLDEACTKEYTEANKNDLVIDCCDGGKIYLKVTPIDNTKTVVCYAYKVSNVGYSYNRGTYLVLVDKTSGYKIITAHPYDPDDKYEDEIKVDGTVLADGVTTVDLTEKDSVTIVCTRNGMD